MHPGLRILEQLVDEERRLVQRLQDGASSSKSPAELLEPSRRRSAEYAAEAPAPEELSDAERALLAERLEEAARLNAVALSLLEGERTELVEQARQTRAIRQGMASLHARGRHTGRSCDVSA